MLVTAFKASATLATNTVHHLDDDKEFDSALCLFYDKYKDIMNDKNTN